MLPETFKQIKNLIGYTGKWKFRFLLGVAGQSLNFLLVTFLSADIMGKVVQAVETKNIRMLYSTLAGMLPLLICIILINAVSKYLSECGSIHAVANIRRQVLEGMLGSSLEKSGEEHSGTKLSYILNDAPVAMEGLAKALQVPVSALLMGTGGFVYVAGVDPRLAMLTLGMCMFTLCYSIFFSRLLRHSSDKAQSALALAGDRLKSLLDGAVTVRIYNMRSIVEKRYNEAAETAMHAGIRFARDSALLGGLNNANHYVGEKLLVFLAGTLLLRGVLDLPELVRVSQVAGGVVGVFQISRILPGIQKSLAGARRISAVLENCGMEEGGAEKIVPSYGGKAITLSRVCFSYEDRKPLIRDISFSVNTGEMVAITGESGCGKSTLLRLVQGLYMPEDGDIEIFGTSTRNAELMSIRNCVSLVPQEVVLFPGTISENISIGCANASRQQVVQAALDANAHDFIMEMKNGYDTYVTERGSSLSGGQRQRIAMARAFIRNSPIILLDEATASLDPQSEELIKKSLLKKKGRQTLLVVTHNRSVADISDKVVQV